MDIPDEAWAAVDLEVDKAVRWDADGNEHYSRHGEAAVHAAAPLIARAAQVQILREMARQLERQSHGESQLVSRGLEAAAVELRARANELESAVHALERTQGRRTDLQKGEER